MARPIRICIEVRGGVVRSVRANTTDPIDVQVVDWDDLESEDDRTFAHLSSFLTHDIIAPVLHEGRIVDYEIHPETYPWTIVW